MPFTPGSTVATQFKPGQSGNPSGRPKALVEITALARENGPEAFRKIVALLDSNDERIVLAAATEILNRAYGRAHQSLGIDMGDRRSPREYSDEELYAIIRAGEAGAQPLPLPPPLLNGKPGETH